MAGDILEYDLDCKAVADGGPSMKRVSPRAMGRATRIRKRTSHITIGLAEPPEGTGRRRRR